MRRPQRKNSLPVNVKPWHEVLPHWELDEQSELPFLDDGRIEFGVWFEPPSRVFYTEDYLAGRFFGLKDVFETALPDGERARIYIAVRTADEEELIAYRDAENSAPHPIIAELHQRRFEHFEHLRQLEQIRTWKFFLTVTVTPDDKFSSKPDDTPSAVELERAVQKALTARADFITQMEHAGFHAWLMTRQEVFSETFLYINPEWEAAPDFIPESEREVHSEVDGMPDHLTLKRQLGLSKVDNAESAFIRVDETYVAALSLHRIPQTTETGYLKGLTDKLVTGSYYIVIEAQRENEFAVEQEIEKRKIDLNTMVNSPNIVPNGRNVDLWKRLKRSEERLRSHSEQRYDTTVTVLLHAKTPQEREVMKRQARSGLKTLRAGMPVQHGFQSYYQWLDLIPFNGKMAEFPFKAITTNAVDFFPPIAPWRGFSRPTIVYRNRENSLVKFDLFEPGTSAASHFAFFAPTRSGKTFGVMSLLTAVMRRYNPIVTIVDAKEDFAPFIKAIHGTIIKFGGKTGTRLNPMDLAPGEKVPDSAKISFLSALILRRLLRQSGNAREAGAEGTAFYEGVRLTYRRFEHREDVPRLRDLHAVLATMENHVDGRALSEDVRAAARSLADRMYLYIGDTDWGRVLDAYTNVDTSARVIYYDLSDVPQDDAHQKSVIGLIVQDRVVQTNKRYPSDLPKIWFYDEFGAQVETEEDVKLVSDILRMAASSGLAMGIATQAPEDIERLKSLKDSFFFQFIGGYSGSVAEHVQRSLNLPSSIAGELKNLKKVSGHYSEFVLLYRPEGGGERQGDIIKFEESQHAYWYFTSDKNDKPVRERYVQAHGGSYVRGINAIMQDFGRVP